MHVVIARRKILSEISSDSLAVSKIDSEDEVALTVDQSSAGQHSQCAHGKNKFHVNISDRKMQKKQNIAFTKLNLNEIEGQISQLFSAGLNLK